nr:hypothetical protein [uncultured Duganella sp.]
MKLFSVVMISIAALTLGGCAATEPQTASLDGTQVAAVKCKRSEASLGSHINRDCLSSGGDAKKVSTEDFMNAVQSPGAIPGKN